MTVVALIARLLLAAVFVVSAEAKLRDRAGSRAAVTDFGVPHAFAPIIATALPFLELLCALLLVLPDPTATAGAIGAGLLLLAFTAGIVVNVVQGRRPDCHCFGRLGAGQIGWSSVVRNVALLVLAGLSTTGDGASVPNGLAAQDAHALVVGAAVTVGVGVLVAIGLLLYHLMRQYGLVLLRLDALERIAGLVDRPVAVPFELPDLDGSLVSLAGTLTPQTPVLIAFIDPDCVHCSHLIPDLAEWQLDPDPAVRVLVLSTGSVEANREKISAAPELQVLLQADWEIAEAYGISGTPGAVVVAVNGRVAVPPAYTVAGVRSLYKDVTAVAAEGDGHHHHDRDEVAVHPGDPLPDVEVATELGDRLPVAELAQDGVLLFWRADCSYCGMIVDEVAALEKDANVLVVTGTPSEAVRASGLTSTLIREHGATLSEALGVPGTPSALRIRNGVIDSELAMGGQAVLILLRDSADSGARVS